MIFEKGDLVEIKKPPVDWHLDAQGVRRWPKFPKPGSLGFIEATSFGSNSLKRNWYFVRMSNGASEVLKDEWMIKVNEK